MLTSRKGSGFAELMIALTILNIILLAMIPTFIYSSKGTLRNNFRTNAYNLGIRQLERIKSLDYEQVGTRNGNPSGLIDYTKTEVRDGISYGVRTRITWVDDQADETYPADLDPRDYKRVEVSVTFPSIARLPNQVFSTDITRQSQEQIATGGNIETTVLDTENNPIEDYLVRITGGPSSPQESYTDETGKTSFVMLDESVEEGDYSLTAIKDGYVLDPAMRNQTTTVRQGETRILQFIASIPGKIRVNLADLDNGQSVNTTTKLTLNYPNAQPLEYTSDTGSFFIEDLFPGVYEVKAENDSYELATERDVRIETDRTTTITLRMKRKRQGNLHLTVIDAQTRAPVPSANVVITGLDVPIEVRDVTNIQGILEKQLGQQNFRLQVSKSNYQTSTTTFSITNAGNTFVEVALVRNAPTTATIRVIVRNRAGEPIRGVRILTMGPNYSRLIRTDSNGEAVFTGLRYGWYNVFRWGWGWRLVGQPLMRLGQERIFYVTL